MNGIRVSLLATILSVCHAETLSSVRGSVDMDGLGMRSHLMVSLEPSEAWKAPAESNVNEDGSFELRDVSTGLHRLRVTTRMGETINEEMVNVSGARPLSIRLPAPSSNRPVTGLVSAKRLLHPVPKKALKAFMEAQKDSEKGRTVEAAQKLELAVSLDPDYFEAHSNLGVQYMRLGRPEEAREQFEKAVAEAPPSAAIYANLGIACMTLGNFEGATDAANRALEIDRSHPAAHFVLGSILARNVRPSSLEKAKETLSHLRQGLAMTPKIHMELARIEEETGDRTGTIDDLRQYLKSGDPTYRAEAERWLGRY